MDGGFPQLYRNIYREKVKYQFACFGENRRNLTGFQICHSEERSDVGISQYPAATWESYRRKRNCLPEIATAPLGPRNDKSGAFAILTAACTDCKCAAGRGMPLPYNIAGSGAVSAGHPTADRQNSYSGRRARSVSRTVSASRGVYSSSPSGHSRIIDTLRRL